MRFSLIIAAHNEGPSLWKTIHSWREAAAGMPHEVVLVDDASWDGSVEEVQRRFPHVRVLRHEQRQGTSPAKDLGARKARAATLIFADGHTRPERGAVRRLVESVEALEGRAVLTPTITGLDERRWRSTPSQIGHGYFLDLESFHCGWLPLGELRAVREGARQFYESPAAIGCVLAVDRQLYEDLWGLDLHMRFWGVEDLDFSLKCWLMGFRVLHDAEAVVAHRFRRRFESFDVPLEHFVANQLRMARKNFTQGVWNEWVDRCRQRHSGRLAEHPEGLWARIWQVFQELRPSAEEERAHLAGQRVRDEFWYAERFGLRWPRLLAAGMPQPLAAETPRFEALAEPSPSPPPCYLTGIDPDAVVICVGQEQQFAAQGEDLELVEWSTDPPGYPAIGSGATFTTVWHVPGEKSVTASCCGTSVQAEVTVVAVDKVIIDGSEPEDEGPAAICYDESITLRARPVPPGASFPEGSPTWAFVEKPEGSQLGNPPPGETAEINPDEPGTYQIKASCGDSSKTFTVYAVGVELALDATPVTLLEEISLTATVTPGSLPVDTYTFEIRRDNSDTWYTLPQQESNEWSGTARVAGCFKVRVRVTIGDTECISEEDDLKVRFPSYGDITGSDDMQEAMDAAWQSTLNATTETTRREEGFWIFINTDSERYEAGETILGPEVGNDEGAYLTPGETPSDVPADPTPLDQPTYCIGFFHTHTPTTYRPVGRSVGPSGRDDNFHSSRDRVGVVYDYIQDPENNGSIPAGHPLNGPSQLYPSGPNRRETPCD